jgi:hypothetical protein
MNERTDAMFSPGQEYRRRELHERFGGQRQGGISTPRKAPFLFLITGESGKQHGYSDEWTDDFAENVQLEAIAFRAQLLSK